MMNKSNTKQAPFINQVGSLPAPLKKRIALQSKARTTNLMCYSVKMDSSNNGTISLNSQFQMQSKS